MPYLLGDGVTVSAPGYISVKGRDGGGRGAPALVAATRWQASGSLGAEVQLASFHALAAGKRAEAAVGVAVRSA